VAIVRVLAALHQRLVSIDVDLKGESRLDSQLEVEGRRIDGRVTKEKAWWWLKGACT
jgi:hypothetical protein